MVRAMGMWIGCVTKSSLGADGAAREMQSILYAMGRDTLRRC